MSLKRLVLLLVLIALTYCCVTCSRHDERIIERSDGDDGSDEITDSQIVRRRRPPLAKDGRSGHAEGWRTDSTDDRDDIRIPAGERPSQKSDENDSDGPSSNEDRNRAQYVNDNEEYQQPRTTAYQSKPKKTSRTSDRDHDSTTRRRDGKRRFGVLDGTGRQYTEDGNVGEVSNSNMRRYPSEKVQKADPAICLGRKSGIHEGGPCEPWYVSCHKKKAKKIFCADGLYWNGDESRCEPKDNIPYCRLKFDCTGLDDGVYVDGCSNVFWFCAGETSSLSKCPKGLYFNAKKLRCDYKKRIPACGGSDGDEKKYRKKKGRKSTARSQKKSNRKAKWRIAYTMMEAGEKHRACVEREDGGHAIGKCYRKYLLCVGGKGLIVNCPNGYLFSRKHGRCVDAEELPSCAHAQHAETTTVAGYYQSKTRSFSPTVRVPPGYSISCDSVPDGTYQLGDCERNFLVCAGGVGTNASCNTGLAFSGLTGQCDRVNNIEKCPQYGMMDVSLSAIEDEECRCKGQPDGLYAVGCTEKFYSCSNGISSGFECPFDLVFNIDTGFCDYPKNVIACGGDPSVLRVASEEEKELDVLSGCSVLDDGIYGLSPCGSGYYHCWRGATSFAKCAFGLVFNPYLGRCDFRENVRSCPDYNGTSADDDNKMRGFTVSPVEGDLSKCQRMNDGFYAEGCNKIYYGCANGEIFYMSCPSNLVFDARSGTCEESQNVLECRNASNEDRTPLATEGSTARPMSSCTVLPDGPHPLDLCMQDHVLCRDGTTRLTSCPDSLIFNPDTSQCDFRTKVIACRRAGSSAENEEPDVECADRPDGIFSGSCSKKFHICAKGRIFRFACPEGLVYNSEYGRCEDSADVRTCIYPTTWSAAEPAASSSVSVEATHHTPLLNSPGGTIVPIMDMGDGVGGVCDGRPDGNYADGPCSKSFFACVNMVKIPMSCPETLIFDATVNRCEDRKDVSLCAAEAAASQGISSGDVTAKQVIFSTSVPYLDEPVCVGRKDGVYSLDSCLRSYFRCYNQKGSDEHCPDNMVFDGTIGACSSVATCIRAASATSSVRHSSASPATQPSSSASSEISHEKISIQIPAAASSPIVINESAEDSGQSASYCRELPDGDYSVGCVADFITCSDGTETPGKCSYPTVFSNVLRRCVPYKECAFLMYRVLASSQSVHTVGEVKRLYNIKAPDSYENTSTSHPEVQQPSYRSGISCWSLPDGDYSHGCANTYTTCVNGITIARSCPPDLIYDANSKRCEFLTECADAPSHITPITPIFRQRINLDIPERMDCSVLRDGVYPLGSCIGRFVQCASTASYVLDCPEGLVFDTAAKRCEFATARCAGGSAAARSSQSSEMNQQKMDRQHMDDESESHFCVPKVSRNRADAVRCETLEDGVYALECSNRIIICDGGQKAIHRCPQGRVFVPESRRCVLPSECHRAQRCDAKSVGVTYVAQFKSDGLFEQPSESDEFCAYQPDGSYGEQCSQSFIQCLRGKSKPRICLNGLVFDQSSSQCIPSAYCELQKTTNAPSKAACVEGARYGLGYCNDYYYTCRGGRFVLARCPPGDAFDAVHGVCTNKCPVCGCPSGEEPMATPSGDRQTAPPDYDELSPSVPEDYNYMLTCEPGEVLPRGPCMDTYLECNEEQKFVIRRCPKNQRFDSMVHLCKPQMDIAECFTSEMPGGVIGDEVRPEDVPCVEGARFGLGYCNDFFYECKNGQLVMEKCLPGDSFDAVRGICANKCDLCGCPEQAQGSSPMDDEAIMNTPCYPGEIVSRGRCRDTYLECNEQQAFELLRCPEGKRFDSELSMCRSVFEIAECFGEEMLGGSTVAPAALPPIPPQPQYHVDDSFQVRSPLPPNIRSIFLEPPEEIVPFGHHPFQPPIQHEMMPLLNLPPSPQFGNPNALPGMLPVSPLDNIFVPKTAPVQPVLSIFGSIAGPQGIVRDTFHAVPAPFGSVPFGHTPFAQGIIDQFRVPNHPPYPLLSYPIPRKPLFASHEGSLETLSPNNDKTDGVENNDSDLEGSGEKENEGEALIRVKRNNDASFERQLVVWDSDDEKVLKSWIDLADRTEALSEYREKLELCGAKTEPKNVTMGFCFRNYIACEGKNGLGHIAICDDWELFDGRLGICVPELDCGRRTVSRRSIINETASVLFECSNHVDGAYALGCSSKFVHCSAGQKHTFVCQEGLIFDGVAQQCRPADLVRECKPEAEKLKSYKNNRTLNVSPCAGLPDGTHSLADCGRHFLSCVSGKAWLRSCARELYYDGDRHQCDYEENVAACNDKTTSSEHSADEENKFLAEGNEQKLRIASRVVGSAIHEVPMVLPNFACSVDSTVSLGCSPSFIVCAGGIVYVFHCDRGLVFDQATSTCNRVEFTAECSRPHFAQRTVLMSKGFGSSSSSKSAVLPKSPLKLSDIASDVSNFDCTNARDGVHAFQCSPLFFVCTAGQITGFLCQDALVFNLETGFCDQREYVSSCGGARLINSPFTLSSTTKKIPPKSSFITTQPSYRSTTHGRRKCGKQFSGIQSVGCSPEFILCASGVDHTFTCQHGLVYNIETNRCDYEGNVAACTGQAPYTEKAYGASGFENGSVSSIRIVDLRAVTPSVDVMKARCSTSWRQAAAYGRCRMDYVSCPEDGTPHQSYCVSGYLFDADVGRCVPADVCGTVDDAVAESMSVTDGMCDGVRDGITKSAGACLNHYYVCMKNAAVRRRCFKHSETFSAASGACVPRTQNPECPGQSIVLADAIKQAKNADIFCVDRPNGMYRHPDDCTRILQCFGGELYEHLPCNDGLVFNEISGGCDYVSNVPDCAAAPMKMRKGEQEKLSNLNCHGKSHGDFIVDEEDCSAYYRCIRGKMERMICPEHTAFNPVLSVCDYPSEVPYCKVTL